MLFAIANIPILSLGQISSVLGRIQSSTSFKSYPTLTAFVIMSGKISSRGGKLHIAVIDDFDI